MKDEAPERIWVEPTEVYWTDRGYWQISGPYDDEPYAKYVRADLAPVVTVKPLEWVDYPYNGEPVLSMAVCSFGTYFICDDTDDFTGLHLEFITHKNATWYGTVKAEVVCLLDHQHVDEHTPLQAVAQADYERRILSAITARTEADARREALEEALNAIAEAAPKFGPEGPHNSEDYGFNEGFHGAHMEIRALIEKEGG